MSGGLAKGTPLVIADPRFPFSPYPHPAVNDHFFFLTLLSCLMRLTNKYKQIEIQACTTCHISNVIFSFRQLRVCVFDVAGHSPPYPGIVFPTSGNHPRTSEGLQEHTKYTKRPLMKEKRSHLRGMLCVFRSPFLNMFLCAVHYTATETGQAKAVADILRIKLRLKKTKRWKITNIRGYPRIVCLVPFLLQGIRQRNWSH